MSAEIFSIYIYFLYIMHVFVYNACIYIYLYTYLQVFIWVYILCSLPSSILYLANLFQWIHKLWEWKWGRRKLIYYNALRFLCSFFCMWIQPSEQKPAWIHDTHCCWLQQKTDLEWLPARLSTGWSSCPYLQVIGRDVKRFWNQTSPFN